ALIVDHEFLHVAPTRRAAAAHALPLHKLVVPLEGASLYCSHAGNTLVFRGPVLVAANVLQAMACSGPSLAVFASPFGSGRSARRALTAIRPLSGREADCARSLAGQLLSYGTAAVLTDATSELSSRLLLSAPLDRRVTWLLENLPAPVEAARPRITTLARALQLSSSRLSHLFSGHTGVSLRSWLSYRRAMTAVRAMAAGASGARAATSCGYADQAHLCRQLRGHFGRTPTEIGSANVQAVEARPR
ncbi:MAG: hypothetical protein RL385_6092, partial [Pseudomonadota bacterium]